MSDDGEIREATRGVFALLTGSMSDMDDEALGRLAADLAGEGGPYRTARMLGAAVGMARELIHELAIATGRPEDEILQEYAARWAE